MYTRHLLLVVGLLGLAVSPDLRADDDPTAALQDAAGAITRPRDRLAVQAALVEFAGAPRLAPYFLNSHACAVFATIGKGGFGVGAAHGKGWVFKENQLVGVSKMTQLTAGFQAGGQAFMQIIFFEDEEAFARFTRGNFEFGAQASAVAITEGANASTSTVGGSIAGAGNAQSKRGYSDGVAVATKAKGGLMYEAAIGGQKFTFRALK